ncbi:MATE family efflux transporter [Desulfosporosinus sp. BG]|uniref:MATE family efflux transporter n=1 Tax=Desulfosporosinus sp. BG TaxID=1633135 RepID=UPI000857624A|nr:MATE family efflux transporter [Desulfosporosinus sp. BG]ODA43125.1 Multi antimicrobial extrusion protein (Na(+)/drug antiporter), MATE family of MDR efflux pump [Desulfosporosinus sp. BG]
METIEKAKRTRDLTEGTIWKQLLLFALPLLGSSLIQQLYNTVDLIFVGNVLGKEASAAVGASSLIITCLVGFFTGLSVGTIIIIAQSFGQKSKTDLQRAVHAAIGLSFLGGVILMVIGYLGAPYFLRWMNTPEEIWSTSLSYLRIYFLSFISVITYNMGAGILRAVGDSKSPLLFQLIGGITNVVMDALFLVVFDYGVDGVAWATLFSQTIAAGCVLIHLSRTKGDHHLSWIKIRLYKDIFFRILKVGVPVGLQSLVITLSNVFVQYQINSFGVDAIAAFTAYFKVELIIYLPIVAFGQAITTFSAQNIGAGKIERMRIGTKICLLIGMTLTIATSVTVLIFGRQAFGVFNPDSSVIDYGIRVIQISFPFYFLYVILEVLGGTIRGAGKSTPPMIIILLNICVLRTILLFSILFFYHDVRGVALTYPITWAVTAACMSVYFFKGKWLKEL